MLDEVGRHPDRGGPVGHIAQDHRVGADTGAVADRHGPEDLGPGPDEHVVPDDRAPSPR